jgi:hypothetical protein
LPTLVTPSALPNSLSKTVSWRLAVALSIKVSVFVTGRWISELTSIAEGFAGPILLAKLNSAFRLKSVTAEDRNAA